MINLRGIKLQGISTTYVANPAKGFKGMLNKRLLYTQTERAICQSLGPATAPSDFLFDESLLLFVLTGNYIPVRPREV
jgi:hypothetical protein